MHLKSQKYVNKKRKKGSQLKKRNKVYLLTKNLTTKRSTKKLNYTKIESFFIRVVKKSVNYKLSLFKNIYIPFDISLWIRRMRSARERHKGAPSCSEIILEPFHEWTNFQNSTIVMKILKWLDSWHNSIQTFITAFNLSLQ